MKATAKNQGNIKRMLQVLAMSMLIVAFAGCKGTTDSGPNNSQVITQVKQKMIGEWIEFGTANKISVTGDLIKYRSDGINFQVKYEPISADSIKIIKGSDYKWQSPSITYHRVSFSDNNGSISISNFVPTDAAATYPANHKDMKIAKGEEQLKSLVGIIIGYEYCTADIKAYLIEIVSPANIGKKITVNKSNYQNAVKAYNVNNKFEVGDKITAKFSIDSNIQVCPGLYEVHDIPSLILSDIGK